MTDLQNRVEAILATPTNDELPPATLEIIDALLGALERGEVRAAERDEENRWRAVPWVKRGILLGFRAGAVVDMSPAGESPFQFYDKRTYPTQDIPLEQGVRIVPGGSTIRRGAHIGKGVVCMPPMYVNVGAWVGAGTMVDSHALVGSCAQIGSGVHLSAAAQIGGVLEPVNAAPVVIEDDVFVGGGCGIYEGTVVRERAVLAAGVILTRGVPVYDLVHDRVIRAGGERPLEIPPGAVVVPGARAASGDWAKEQGLSLYAPMIVKYRDEGTDASTALEAALR